MNLPQISLLLFALVAAAIGYRVIRQSEAKKQDKAWRPAALREAGLAYAEKTFRTRKPFPLVARVDRAYRRGDTLVLAELKTRRFARVYEADVFELSAQRLAMERQTGQRVSNIGIMLIQDDAGRTRAVQKVRLLDEDAVTSIAARREAILAAKIEPRYASSTGLCRRCVYLKMCRPGLRSQLQGE